MNLEGETFSSGRKGHPHSGSEPREQGEEHHQLTSPSCFRRAQSISKYEISLEKEVRVGMSGTILRIQRPIMRKEMMGAKPLLVRGKWEVRPPVFPITSRYPFASWIVLHMPSFHGHTSKPTGPLPTWLCLGKLKSMAVFRARLSVTCAALGRYPAKRHWVFFLQPERQRLPKWKVFLHCPNKDEAAVG